MTCMACQNRIEKALGNTRGINSVSVSYSGGYADISYDDETITPKKIGGILRSAGYTVITRRETRVNTRQTIVILFLVVIAFFILSHFNIGALSGSFPVAKEGTAYGMLFLIGLLTSVHCIAMCGGLNLSQCIPAVTSYKGDFTKKTAALIPALSYNLSRLVSYTVIGAVVGTIGSVITPSGNFKGIIEILAGVFMVIMGLNLLGILPGLSRIVPHMPKSVGIWLNNEHAGRRSPIVVGLLNGLMPCGPLQAMQLYALSTASPVKGALSMFLFAAGTLPLMFGLSMLSGVLTKNFTKWVMTVGAALVIVLGLLMFTSGWALSGGPQVSILPEQTTSGQTQADEETGDELDVGIVDGDVQNVRSVLSGGRYPNITVKAGVPVKWTIEAGPGQLTGCNYRMVIPEFDVQYEFTEGENLIEFTPEDTGSFGYTCWMGMVRGNITVE